MQSEPVQVVSTVGIIAVALGAMLGLCLVGGLIFLFVRLAARRPALLIATFLFAGAALLIAAVLGIYFVRLEAGEAALRADRQQEMKSLAAALHEYQAAQPVQASPDEAVAPPSAVLDYRGGNDVAAGSTDVVPPSTDEQNAGSEQSSLELVSYVGRDIVGQRLTELPDWVDDEPVADSLNGTARKVLTSDQWATAEEADAQLTTLAAAELSRYLAAEHPQAAGWLPDTSAIVQSGAITRRVQETSTLPIGEFNPPLYRSYWQLELTPDVREQLADAWRPYAVSQRLSWLGAGVIGLTLLFAALAAILRLGRASTARVQPVLSNATIVAALIAAGAAAMMLA